MNTHFFGHLEHSLFGATSIDSLRYIFNLLRLTEPLKPYSERALKLQIEERTPPSE